MKFITSILLLFMGCLPNDRGSIPLFPIVVNEKVGYIDASGKVVIQPQFYDGGAFSEGLAPVRKDGLYGYINSRGTFVIPQQFEYALPFQQGFAIVYTDGKPGYINKKGKQPFPTPFDEIGSFSNGRAYVKTVSGKMGFLNTSGRLFIDTVYKNIHEFSGGLAVVEGLNDGKEVQKGKFQHEVGVIDSAGKLVVPYGRYNAIGDFQNGYAHIDIRERNGDENGETAKSGFIDGKGSVVLLRNNSNNSWIEDFVSDGIAIINLYKYWLPEEKGVLWSSERSYKGYINLKGEIILNDTTLVNSTDFSEGRAFVSRKFGDYYLINTNGSRISKNTFNKILNDRFYDGVAFVLKDFKWGIINRDGNYIVDPQFEEVSGSGPVNGYFYYSEFNRKGDRYNQLYGLAKLDGRIITKPIFEVLDPGGFQNGLLRGQMDGSLVYLDTAGRIVWKAPKQQASGLKNFNIDYMNRGYFYASSSLKDEDYNGWGLSANRPGSISKRPDVKGLLIIVDTTARTAFAEKYNGYTLRVENHSADALEFEAQDSRLYLKVQAMDPKGKWRDIEYTPSSWCGNSYHTLNLAPQTAWKFSIPVYEGEFKTKLRAELTYVDPTDHSSNKRKRKQLKTYSNIFEGSINLGQFWRKPEWFPGGIMDPYYD